MVERAATGEAPSSPQPPEAGARRARLYGASPVAENRNRQTMSSSRCGAGWPMWRGIGSADLEHVADLPLAARCGLAASFCTFDLPLADVRESATSISTRRRASSLRLIVITVIPRHLDKPQANRGA